jgi:cellobiose phosphorylase
VIGLVGTDVQPGAAQLEQQALGELGLERMRRIVEHADLVRALLGIELAVDKLRIAPCLPADWKEFTLDYRYRETVYRITVSQTPSADRQSAVWVDGDLQSDNVIPLVNDRVEHAVRVQVSPAAAT